MQWVLIPCAAAAMVTALAFAALVVAPSVRRDIVRGEAERSAVQADGEAVLDSELGGAYWLLEEGEK